MATTKEICDAAFNVVQMHYEYKGRVYEDRAVFTADDFRNVMYWLEPEQIQILEDRVICYYNEVEK